MPPTSGGLGPVLGSFLDTEGAEDSVLDNREVLQYSEIPSGLSDQQIYILRCVSLSLSLFTLSLIVLVTYWFFRMRRSFRHDLIMLLIVSDGLEALFFMIFPIVDFAMGPIQSESVFCQMSGFFLAVGIEASDIAVALIAIHTALYIFKPRQLNGQSGLYPYRRTAYAVVFILPIVLASLAFINTPAYVNNGQYCYLPIRPLWARLALSWIPRYIILLIIFVSYFCTYIYVSVLMHRFGEESKMRRHSNAPPPPPVSSDQTTSSPSNVSNNQADTRNGSVPPTPPIAYHGLIPSTSDSHHSCSEEERQRHGSVSSEGSCGEPLRRPLAGRLRVDSHHTAHGIRWKWPLFGGEAVASMDTQQQRQQQRHLREAIQHQEQYTTQHDAHVEAVHFPQQADNRVSYQAIASPPPARTSDPTTARHSLPPSLGKTSDQSPSSLSSPSGRPYRHPHTGSSSTAVSSTPSPSPFLFAVAASAAPLRRTGGTRTGIGATANDPSGNMARARLKIRRQLRLLFVYPLVYMLVWAVPFAQHVLRWNEPLRAGPFGLVLASLVSLCMQGAADAVLFALREKPWRHGHGTARQGAGRAQTVAVAAAVTRGEGRGVDGDGGRRGSWRTRWGMRQGEGPGRTREEMLFDGRNARARRDIEASERRTRQRSPRTRQRSPRTETETEWWEWLDHVGAEGEDHEGQDHEEGESHGRVRQADDVFEMRERT
ncbi:hypothetical protein ACHAP0_000762 [Verticillium nonalfalfae]